MARQANRFRDSTTVEKLGPYEEPRTLGDRRKKPPVQASADKVGDPFSILNKALKKTKDEPGSMG